MKGKSIIRKAIFSPVYVFIARSIALKFLNVLVCSSIAYLKTYLPIRKEQHEPIKMPAYIEVIPTSIVRNSDW